MIVDSIYSGIYTILGLLNLAVLGLAIFGFMDAIRRSDSEFEFIGKGQKTAWLVGLAIAGVIVYSSGVLSFFGLLATVAIIVYMVDIRPKLNGKFF